MYTSVRSREARGRDRTHRGEGAYGCRPGGRARSRGPADWLVVMAEGGLHLIGIREEEKRGGGGGEEVATAGITIA